MRDVLAVMPRSRYPHIRPFRVEVSGETVTIPYRIYHDEPVSGAQRSLTATQRLILHCLYSRDGDGRVRQRHLEQILGSSEPWAAPFVVQLVGEYVLEILEAIRYGLPDLATPWSASWKLYGDFLARNPAFFRRTERRVVSYWSCHHRRQYPVFGAYPGCLLLEALHAAAADRSARPWPRHAPHPLTGPGRSSPCSLQSQFDVLADVLGVLGVRAVLLGAGAVLLGQGRFGGQQLLVHPGQSVLEIGGGGVVGGQPEPAGVAGRALEGLVLLVSAPVVVPQLLPEDVQLAAAGALVLLVGGGAGVAGGVQTGGDRVGGVEAELGVLPAHACAGVEEGGAVADLQLRERSASCAVRTRLTDSRVRARHRTSA